MLKGSGPGLSCFPDFPARGPANEKVGGFCHETDVSICSRMPVVTFTLVGRAGIAAGGYDGASHADVVHNI